MLFSHNKTFLPSPCLSEKTGPVRCLRAGVLSVVLSCCLLAFAVPSQASPTAPATGRASWYGTTSHGKPTANGEIYDSNALTAAHKQLPFGTVVRVYNLRNGKYVLLRINDRGPFVKGRIIDVSHRAAGILQMKHSGVVPVAVEIVTNKKGIPLNEDNRFYLHLADETGSLKSRVRAMQLEETLQTPVLPLRLEKKTGNTPHYALCVGPYGNFQEAEKAYAVLTQQGHPPLRIVEGPVDTLKLPKHRPPSSTQNTAENNAAEQTNKIKYLRTAVYSPLHLTSRIIPDLEIPFIKAIRNVLIQ